MQERDVYPLTERESKIIQELIETRERIEEATRNALTMIAACRELDGPYSLDVRRDGVLVLVPSQPTHAPIAEAQS